MAKKIQQLAIFYTVGSVSCITTHHFAGVDGGNEDPAGLAADFDIAMTTILRGALPTSVSIEKYKCTPVAPLEHAADVPGERTVGANGTHAVTGDLLPPSWCFGTTIRTDRAARWARGRNYWSGAAESDVSVSGFSLAAGTLPGLLESYYTALLDRMGRGSTWGSAGFSGVFEWGIFSRKRWKAGYGEEDYWRPVTGWTKRTEPRNMSSRRR